MQFPVVHDIFCTTIGAAAAEEYGASSAGPTSSSPYATHRRDTLLHGGYGEVDERRHLHELSYDKSPNTGMDDAAIDGEIIEKKFRAFPLSQQQAALGNGLLLEEQQQQWPQQQRRKPQHREQHLNHQPVFEIRDAADFRSHCRAGQDHAGSVTDTSSGWQQSRTKIPDPRDTNTVLGLMLPHERGLNEHPLSSRDTLPLGGQNRWEQYRSQGGGRKDDPLRFSGCYAAVARNSLEHHQIRRLKMSPTNQQSQESFRGSGNAEEQREVSSSLASSFLPETSLCWEESARIALPAGGQAGRDARRRHHTVADVFSAGSEAYPTSIKQPPRPRRRTWELCSPQQRQQVPVGAAHDRNGQVHGRAEDFPPSFPSLNSEKVLNTISGPHPRSECQRFRERQYGIVVGARTPLSPVDVLAVPPQCSGGVDGSLRHDEQWWHELDNGRRNSVSTFTGSNGGIFPIEGVNDRHGQVQSEATRGSVFATALHNDLHGQHHQRLNDRSTTSFASAGHSNSGTCRTFNRRAVSEVATVEPPSIVVGEKQGRLDGDMDLSGSQSCPQFGRLEGFQLSSPESAPVGQDDDITDTAEVRTSRSPARASSSTAVLPTHENLTEWVQNIRLNQSRNGSNSSSSSSNPDATTPPAQGQGEANAAATAYKCPSPDCPEGNATCLPGATPDMLVYEVKFKRATRTFLPWSSHGPEGISCGTLMKVEADRGEDLGAVHRSLPLSEYLHVLHEEKMAKAAKIAENGGGGGGGGAGEGSESKKKRSKSRKAEDEVKGMSPQQQQRKKQKEAQEQVECPVRAMKRILRQATSPELQQLRQKSQEEDSILRVCQNKVRQRRLPMTIVDAEYQFDMHKLTLFFEAERRIDFRELVRDLFAVYKTRIWMQQVKDKDLATTKSNTSVTPSSVVTATTAPSSSDNDPSSSATCLNNGNNSTEQIEGAIPPSVQPVAGENFPGGFLPSSGTEQNPGIVGEEKGWDGHSDTSGSGGHNDGSSSEVEHVDACTGEHEATGNIANAQSQLGQEHQVVSSSSLNFLQGFHVVEAANAMDGDSRQQQQFHQHQRQVGLGPSYLNPDMLDGSGVSGTAPAVDTEISQHHQRQQLQQQSQLLLASSSSLSLGGPDFGEVVDRKTELQESQHLHLLKSHPSTSSCPGLLEGFNLGGLAHVMGPELPNQYPQQQQFSRLPSPLDPAREFDVGGVVDSISKKQQHQHVHHLCHNHPVVPSYRM